MFRCKECQREYDIKPDFCDDCGNDIFEEIEVATISTEQKIKTPAKKETREFEPSPKPVDKAEEKQIDYPSISFLLICILISIFILFFAWNDKIETQLKQTKTTVETKTTNIPNIDSFWNSEPPKPQQVIQKTVDNKIEQFEVQNIAKTEPRQSNKATYPPKTAKTVQKIQPEVQQPKTIRVKLQKQVSQPKTIQTRTVQPQAKPQTKQSQQNTTPKPTQNQTTATQTVQQQQQIQQPKPAQTTTSQIDSTLLKKELSNYKVSLRNAIGKKIDFAYVIGDGTCVVSFRVDSNGKLVNRAFAQQSTNTTLNDAVYKAIMATPSYNPPPSGYKNETMHLKITFYNGNFQISLN